MSILRAIFRFLRRCVYAGVMAGFVALAVRGYWRYETWWSATMGPQVWVHNYAGRVDVTLVWYPMGMDPRWGRGGYDGHPEDPEASRTAEGEVHFYDDIRWRRDMLGVVVRSGWTSTSGSEVPRFDAALVSVAFSPWLGAVLAAVPLAWAVGGWWRRRRRPEAGKCGRCGYDLRAHVAGQRCPECGTVIEAANGRHDEIG